MLGEGTSARLIKFYTPVLVAEIEEKNRREGGNEGWRKGGRARKKEREREKKKKNKAVCLWSIHYKEDCAADLWILPVLCAQQLRNLFQLE